MKGKSTKIKNSITLSSLDRRMDHLEKTVENLTVTVDNLAMATAKGFANTATKQDLERFATKLDLENLGNRIDNSLEEFVRVFRGDYDELSSRVKRLEVAVFKR